MLFLPLGYYQSFLGNCFLTVHPIFLHTDMKEILLPEGLKRVLSEFAFNVFKEKIRGIFLFRDDAEVKAGRQNS